MIGGGSIPRPGEVTLAHHGVLFLDELPEFSKKTLEVLRERQADAQSPAPAAGRRRCDRGTGQCHADISFLYHFGRGNERSNVDNDTMYTQTTIASQKLSA